MEVKQLTYGVGDTFVSVTDIGWLDMSANLGPSRKAIHLASGKQTIFKSQCSQDFVFRSAAESCSSEC
jgi:hypothetical protein